jgi:hypothetical protein
MRNMKKIVLLNTAILIVAVISGCSGSTKTPTIQQSKKVTESIGYENTKYNFILKLPKSWEGTYYVKDHPVTPGNNIDFISKDNPDYDVLFSIFILSKDYWIKHEEEVKGQIPISLIGEKSDKIYLFVSQSTMQTTKLMS